MSRRADVADENLGREILAVIEELYPICRSITGDGVRQTLAIVGRQIPLERHEVPSGTRVLDWTVPDEWNVRDAWVNNRAGERVIDFRRSNLHLLNYSEPVAPRRVSRAELLEHLHTLPEHPDWIPYRTSYYRPAWGFCLAQRTLEGMTDGSYEVCVDTTLAPGALTYGECILPGDGRDEVFFSCHCCHPSLANDNLSGIAVATALARYVAELPRRRYTYRFLFIPGTIGAITWLARHEEDARRIRHGLVLSGLGDGGPLTYKRSRVGQAPIDRAAALVLAGRTPPGRLLDFSPYGYDERQYGSPGFDLPVGRLGRTPHGEYPEYHTSADDLSFVRPDRLADSLEALVEIVHVLEHDGRYLNRYPKGEPQLGRRGLYRQTGGAPRLPQYETAVLWVLNQSDGRHSLLDIAARAGLPFAAVRQAAQALEEAGLVTPEAAE